MTHIFYNETNMLDIMLLHVNYMSTDGAVVVNIFYANIFVIFDSKMVKIFVSCYINFRSNRQVKN